MKCRKYIFCLATVLIFNTEIFAQESDSEQEQIALPEVTTVISTSKLSVEPDALPDFENVVEIEKGSGDIQPVLPEESSEEQSIAALLAGNNEQSIYAEGKVGGGYPNLFYGDFSVYRLNGDSPFKINFTHRNSAGYSRQALTDSYYNNFTQMDVEKSFAFKNLDFNFGVNYKTNSDGLQKKSDSISDTNQYVLSADGNVVWKLPKGFLLGMNLETEDYNRYAHVVSDSESVADFVKGIQTLEIETAPFAQWSGYGVCVQFTPEYRMISDLNKNLTNGNLFNNRGQFNLSFSWNNDYVKINTDVAAVVGNYLNSNPVIVPFTIGVDGSIPFNKSNRNITISAQGGLDSYMNNPSVLEQKYKFTGFSVLPSESSDWYGKFNLELPFKTTVSSKFGLEYRQTALNNGSWVPLYNSDEGLTSGIYGFEKKNTKYLTSNLEASYLYKILSVSAQWHSNWIDIPCLETAQMINFDVVLQNSASTWNGSLHLGIFLDDEFILPLINLSGFVNVTPSVRLVASVNDIINILGGEARTYAGQYISEGGSAALLVKFNF